MCTVYRLTVLSLVLGATSVALFALAVSTDSWLITRESLPMANEDSSNGTTRLVWIRVWMGLWRLCMVHEEVPDDIICMAAGYHDLGTGREEILSATSFVIIVTTSRSAALPVMALILAMIAVICSVVGNIKKDVKSLVGGVLFILSGLSLAVGMILYISAINDEVGFRVSTNKSGSGGFSYEYGWSFFTAGFGFLSSEMAAVVTVTLFLKRNAKLEDMARIIPGLEDKVSSDPEQTNEFAEACASNRRRRLGDMLCFRYWRSKRSFNLTV